MERLDIKDAINVLKDPGRMINLYEDSGRTVSAGRWVGKTPDCLCPITIVLLEAGVITKIHVERLGLIADEIYGSTYVFGFIWGFDKPEDRAEEAQKGCGLGESYEEFKEAFEVGKELRLAMDKSDLEVKTSL